MNRVAFLIACLGLTVSAAQAADKPSLPAAAPGTMDFRRDIQPIFTRACLSCHCGGKQKGGLRLDDRQAAMKGSNSGPIIRPGDAASSRLLVLVAGLDPDLKMPPRGAALTSAEIARLRAWIEQGARWPQEAGMTSSGQSQSGHWAFQPMRRPPLPVVAQTAQVRNPIDVFLQARLEAEKIAPSPEADPVTLLRRLNLDLLGLPPTPQEVDDFLADARPGAYERLVDRLLASPHYGERWGRHWLDLARYADSDGFEKDTGRPHAWRYRHWVIDALNRDMPFDRFTIEQLAGDLLPGATSDQQAATGFHRNTLTNKEGGVDQEQFRVEQVVDRVNTTAKVLLGTTLGCAQCHDHKFDPFTQREYYQFFAFFNSDVEADLPAPLPGESERYQPKQTAFARRHAELQAARDAYVKEQLPARQQQWETELKVPDLRRLPPAIVTLLLVEQARRSVPQKKELADFYARTDTKLVALTKAVADHQKTAPTQSLAQTLRLGNPRKTHVLIRGDFLRPGVEIEAGTPAVLPPLAKKGKTPTRLDLAEWIVDPANPLTARVIVNWMWHHYFGRGIVATLEDFGTQGEKPAHPALLDYLASELVRRQWSLKAMHRLIVTSAAYRRSAQARPDLTARDPLNVLLARQTRPRLEAEIVRDNALAASGLLIRTIGGHSVRPPQPAGIAELTYGGSHWVTSSGLDRYRRGLYTWFQRTSPYPMLMVFDAPDSNVCCVRRERSDTPLQALTLLNDPVFFECAQALGRRVVEEQPGDLSARIRLGFRLCLAREPAPDEMALLHHLFEDLLQTCRAKPDAAAQLVGSWRPIGVEVPEAAAWVGLARTLLNLDEFVTRE
jgi:hypothetical protein